MHNIPNFITAVRLISAVLIAALTVFNLGKAVFLPLFIVAAVSDMLDGMIARKFNWCTEFGAKLDSVSDMSLYAAVFFCFLVCLPDQMQHALGLLLFGAAAQIIHWLFSVQKHGGFPAYHSTFSRICAYAMFFATLAFWHTHSVFILCAILLAWIACTIEGMIITALLSNAASNVASIKEVMVLNALKSECRS